MAARRLLIVMLVLLGISTLAAALVPQHALRNPNPTTTTTTTTQTAPTTTSKAAASGKFFPIQITVGGSEVVVACSAAKLRKGGCNPIRVGDQIALSVYSRKPVQLSIPTYGQFGFAAPNAPAMFELIADHPGTFGILFEPSGKVAAQIRVSPSKPKKKS